MFMLLLFYYWLLVSASTDHHQANIYKKLKMLVCLTFLFVLYGRAFEVFCTYWPDDGLLRLKLVVSNRLIIT